MAEINSHSQAFNSWKAHNNGDRINTDSFMHQFLIAAYPGYHITRTSGSCDLLGFAAAGFATATPGNRDEYDAIRVYKSRESRLEQKPGNLQDDVSFAQWTYAWEGKQFILYQVHYRDCFNRLVKLLYILSPATAGPDEVTLTDALLLAAGAWTKELHDEIYVFDAAHWCKDKALYKSVQSSTWADVILDPVLKSDLIQDFQSFFDNRALYKSMSVPWKRGVIFHGVPGNGKTLSIKALINSLAARPEPIPSLYVKNFDACHGPKWSIDRIFSHARAMAPCLLIFEDLDSMVEQKTRSYFLNEVDGLESNEGILMIGSTNHLDRLDPAIAKRPSRFDRKYHFKIPAEPERVEYCRFWAGKFAGSSAVDFPEEICPLIAKMTEGFSFAYLKELFISSLLLHTGDSYKSEPYDTEVEEEVALLSDSSSASDGVVIEHSATMPRDDDIVEKTVSVEEGCQAKDTQPEKPKRVFPVVEIPAEWQDNVLLRILKAQAKGLLEQMDNSEEDQKQKPRFNEAPELWLDEEGIYLPNR
jgi:transitional endoplasmic reticulum ATPase